MKSPLTNRFYAVGDNYKPGMKKHDVTPYIEEIVKGELERIIAWLSDEEVGYALCLPTSEDGEYEPVINAELPDAIRNYLYHKPQA